MYLGFTDQVMLITGGTGGIGKELVLAALERGAKVAFSWSNNEESLQQLLDSAMNADCRHRLLPIRADISSETAIANLFDKAEEAFGPLDVLINNAAVTHDALLASLPAHRWDQMIAVNLTACFLTCKYAVNTFLKHGKRGSILNIGSLAQKGAPSNACYAASKGGLVGLTNSIANQFSTEEIRANVVALGLVDTSMTAEYSRNAKQVLIESSPLKRSATPREAALNLLFFASQEANGINGQVVYATNGIFDFPLELPLSTLQ